MLVLKNVSFCDANSLESGHLLSFFEVGFSEVSKPASAAAIPRDAEADGHSPAAGGSTSARHCASRQAASGTIDTSTTSDSHPAPCCSRLWQNGGCCTSL
jgi:hypothetical protein